MNTFLPYPCFEASAKCLDNKRLGKQRVEVLQLLKALAGEKSRWVNHPCCKMWIGYEHELAAYGNSICMEWMRRGFKDTCLDKIKDIYTPYYRADPDENPPWFGDEDFHASHRSNLLRKDAVHYGEFGWEEENDLPYVWPESDRTEPQPRRKTGA